MNHFDENKPSWCQYCLEEILEDDDIVTNKGEIYHLYCWKLMHDVFDELDFPTGDFQSCDDDE